MATLRWLLQDEEPNATVVGTGDASNGTLLGGNNTDDLSVSGPGGDLAKALYLEATTDRISLDDLKALFTDQLTVGGWCQFRATGDNPVMLSAFAGSGNAIGFEFRMSTTTTRASFLVRRDGANMQLTVDAPDAIDLDEWVHLAATYNDGVLKIFINGVETADMTDATGGNISFGATTDFTIGARSNGTQPADAEFAGVLLADTAYTEAQIQTLMEETDTPPEPPAPDPVINVTHGSEWRWVPKRLTRGDVLARWVFDGEPWNLLGASADSVEIDMVDTANASDFAPNGKGLRFRTIPGGTQTQVRASNAVAGTPDLSNADFHIRFVLDPGDQAGVGDDQVRRIRLRPVSGSDVESITIWQTGNFWIKGLTSVGMPKAAMQVGYTDATAALSGLTELGVMPSWQVADTYVGSIVFTEIVAVERPTKGIIVIRPDDGRKGGEGAGSYNHFNYGMYAASKGIPLSFAVIKRDSWTNRVDPDEWRILRDDPVGHVLACHMPLADWPGSGGSGSNGWVRRADNSLTTHAQRAAGVVEYMEWAREEGLAKHARILIVPGGDQGKNDQQLIEDGLVDCLHYTRSGWHNRNWGNDTPPPISGQPGATTALTTCYLDPEAIRYGGTTLNIDGATDFETHIKPYLDAAATEKARLQINCHTVPDVLFEEVIDYVADLRDAGDIDVQTIADDFEPQSQRTKFPIFQAGPIT